MTEAGAGCVVHRLVADVCLTAEGAVLLVRYNDVTKYDGEPGWFLPDDFLAEGEHPQRAARRILADQVGLADLRPALGFIESFTNGAWHLIFHHRLAIERRPQIRPSSALAEARWFDLNELPPADQIAHGGWALELVERHRQGDGAEQP
jgi:ADP-ribose pyrophosphatase YjhB (NUDIX family)